MQTAAVESRRPTLSVVRRSAPPPHAVVRTDARSAQRLSAVTSDWLWARISPEGRTRLLAEHGLLA